MKVSGTIAAAFMILVMTSEADAQTKSLGVFFAPDRSGFSHQRFLHDNTFWNIDVAVDYGGCVLGQDVLPYKFYITPVEEMMKIWQMPDPLSTINKSGVKPVGILTLEEYEKQRETYDEDVDKEVEKYKSKILSTPEGETREKGKAQKRLEEILSDFEVKDGEAEKLQDDLAQNTDTENPDEPATEDEAVKDDAEEAAETADDGSEKELAGLPPMKIRKAGVGMAFVPEDRLGMGLVGSMGMTGNMMLRSWRKGRGIFVKKKEPKELADKILSELEVVTPGTDYSVRKLSGGNVQKVLVGREIAIQPQVLLTAYAVRGLDINTSYTIYRLLTEQKMKGVAVLYVGEDLDVLIELCDRILVLCDGRVSGIVDGRTATKEEIGLMMTHIGNKEAADE